MKVLPLNRGLSALVDDADYDLVMKYHWYAAWGKTSNTWYAAVTNTKPYIQMHRLILGAKAGEEVDHRDHNGLNNTRANIRICTHRQNHQNMRKYRGGKCPYKGVYFFSHKPVPNPWYVQITVNGKILNLGMFSTPEEGAQAYNEAAKKHFGEFAHLNVIPKLPS